MSSNSPNPFPLLSISLFTKLSRNLTTFRRFGTICGLAFIHFEYRGKITSRGSRSLSQTREKPETVGDRGNRIVYSRNAIEASRFAVETRLECSLILFSNKRLPPYCNSVASECSVGRPASYLAQFACSGRLVDCKLSTTS